MPHPLHQVSTLKGHTERVAGLAWHPEATKGLSPSAANLVSGGCDGVAKLWSLDATEPVGELKGHAGRLSRVAFHPSGRYVGTTSFDTSWRLWDVESCRELLLQERGGEGDSTPENRPENNPDPYP